MSSNSCYATSISHTIRCGLWNRIVGRANSTVHFSLQLTSAPSCHKAGSTTITPFTYNTFSCLMHYPRTICATKMLDPKCVDFALYCFDWVISIRSANACYARLASPRTRPIDRSTMIRKSQKENYLQPSYNYQHNPDQALTEQMHWFRMHISSSCSSVSSKFAPLAPI